MMTSADPSPRSGVWSRAEPPPQPSRSSAATTFLGGTPIAVAIRLAVLSLLVGIVLMGLNIRLEDLVFALDRFASDIWNLGFEAVREAADYVLAGALIVVPIWFITRLLRMRSLW